MLNCGDEIGQLNGWDYKNDPALEEDSRNLHRSRFDWDKAALRHTPGTLQNELWQRMLGIKALRSTPAFGPGAWVTTWDAHNQAILAVVRKQGEETLLGLFNFSGHTQTAHLNSIPGVPLPQQVTLMPYGYRIIS